MNTEHACYCCNAEGDLIKVRPSSPLYAAYEQHGGPVCSKCFDDMWLDLEVQDAARPEQPHGPRCPKCNGKGKFGSEYHYVRQAVISNDCPRCDGDGYLLANNNDKGETK